MIFKIISNFLGVNFLLTHTVYTNWLMQSIKPLGDIDLFILSQVLETKDDKRQDPMIFTISRIACIIAISPNIIHTVVFCCVVDLL